MKHAKPVKLKVKAAHADRPVFPEGGDLGRVIRRGIRVHLITHDMPIDVPNTRYYQRRIAKGDLVIVDSQGHVKKEKE